MKHVKLFEQFLSEGKADLPAGMEKFMAGFPDNATSWAQATDELSELAWLMREFHVTIDQDLLLDEPGAYPEPPIFRKGDPGERNAALKQYVKQLWPLLGDWARKQFIKDAKGRFGV